MPALLLAACGGAAPAAPPLVPTTVPTIVSTPTVVTSAARAGSASALGSAAGSVSPAPIFGHGTVSVVTKTGPVTLSVEVADDETKREYGLMNRSALPPEKGMLFVFQPPADAKQVGFWMKDTLIPLSVAFVEPNMSIESIQDMQALSEDIHYAPRNYAYAIETNVGYFTSHGIAAGDRVTIQQA